MTPCDVVMLALTFDEAQIVEAALSLYAEQQRRVGVMTPVTGALHAGRTAFRCAEMAAVIEVRLAAALPVRPPPPAVRAGARGEP